MIDNQINTLFPKAICKTRPYYFKTNCVCSEKNFLILYIRIPIFSYLYIPNNSLKERNTDYHNIFIRIKAHGCALYFFSVVG